MKMLKTIGRYTLAGLACAVLATGGALAQTTYPDRAITMVVPYPPGGPNDIVARSISEEMAKALGQPVIIDNRSGAGGNIGTAYVGHAKPDGYTLLLAATPLVANPSLYPDVNYDPFKDLTGVAMVSIAPLVLVVPAALPIKSVKELIDYAKANPGKLNFGTGGAGTGLHLAAELFMNDTGVEMTHIPYQGNAQVMPDLLAGRIDVLFSAMGTALPHIKSGALRALAVTTKARSSVLPDIPTMEQAGVPGFEFGSWYVVATTAGTPQPILQKLNTTVVDIIKTPEVQAKFDKLSAVAMPYSLAQTNTYLKDQYDLWSKIIKQRNISAK